MLKESSRKTTLTQAGNLDLHKGMKEKYKILNLNFLEIWDRFLKITEDCRVYNVHHKGEM